MSLGQFHLTMLKNYFLITLRSMMKNKLFILINIIGMSIAIADCFVGYFAWEYDSTFNSNHINGEQIYRVSSVRNFENNLKRYGMVPFGLGEVVSKTMPDVDQSARFYHSWSNFKRENDLFPANLYYVDPDFFKLFSFQFVAGSPSDIKDKNSVFLSESMAVRLFQSPAEALSKTITQVYGTELKEVKVAGVFREQPMNSSFYRMEGSAFMNFENYKDEHKGIAEGSWKDELTLFVRIDNAQQVESVFKSLQPLTENNNKVREDFQIKEFTLDPLPSMATRDRAENVQTRTWDAPPISAVIGSMVMGVMILLIACFNLTNTTIAISSRRLKEIGLRKVMGSLRKHLITQYIGETMFICFISLLLGLVLTEFLVRGWNYMWQYFQLTPHYLDNPTFLIVMSIILLVTGFLAGSYPALYISKFEPVSILKGKLRFGGTNHFTRTLLGLQFAFSLIAIVSAIGFMQNARYQREYDMGFDLRGSIVAWVNDQSEYETYRNELQSNPDIVSMAGAQSGIFSNRAHEPVKFESRQLEVDIIEVGDNYLHTMDLKLVEGRDFIKDSETDRKESIIISRKMADAFGWEQPIGKEVVWKDSVKLYVIGVVKDVYTMGLWREMEPLMIRYILPSKYSQIVVNTRAEKLKDVNNFMKQSWTKVFPNRLYNGVMMEEDLQQVSEVNINIVWMFTFLGGVALMLSATGLFTLVSLNIIRRMKEIGVRKVLGATVSNIARIVNTEFFVILLLASALGCWASYELSNLLMSSIWRYYQGVNILTFTLSIAILVAISILSVGYKIYSAAAMNPVDSLKDE